MRTPTQAGLFRPRTAELFSVELTSTSTRGRVGEMRTTTTSSPSLRRPAYTCVPARAAGHRAS
eukprot:13292117-Heterocapsa_arctica.AAC.1